MAGLEQVAQSVLRKEGDPTNCTGKHTEGGMIMDGRRG